MGAFPGLLGIAAYLLAGIIGFPVFAEYNSGIDTFMSPSGGFLLGFILTGWLAGWGYQKCAESRIGIILLLFISCQLLLLLQGAIGLAVYGIALNHVVSVLFGLLPGLLVKSLVATMIVVLVGGLRRQSSPAANQTLR